MTTMRDQTRARHAYRAVAELTDSRDSFDNFKTLTNGFAAAVLRGGLCSAIAWAQRYHDASAAKRLFDVLGGARIATVGKVAGKEFARAVHRLTTSDYMLATRDTVAFIAWLKRANQAAVTTKSEPGAESERS